MIGKYSKLFIIIICASAVVYLFSYMWEDRYLDKFLAGIDHPTDKLIFENLASASVQPIRDGNNIFFLETRSNAEHSSNLTKRQACAIESAGEFYKHLAMTILANAVPIFKPSPILT